MKFAAEHISHSLVEDGWVLALADSADGAGQTHILLSYGEEDEQERSLGLTGLFISSTWSNLRGYGFVERLTYDGQTLSIIGCNGHEDVRVLIATNMMSPKKSNWWLAVATKRMRRDRRK